MAHYAEINKENIVVRVLAIADKDTIDNTNKENEEIGKKFCRDNFGGEKWIKTSYNNIIRKKFAAIGDSYDESLDAFIPPKPHRDLVLNKETCKWEHILPIPDDVSHYSWNSNTLKWDLQETSVTGAQENSDESLSHKTAAPIDPNVKPAPLITGED